MRFAIVSNNKVINIIEVDSLNQAKGIYPQCTVAEGNYSIGQDYKPVSEDSINSLEQRVSDLEAAIAQLIGGM